MINKCYVNIKVTSNIIKMVEIISKLRDDLLIAEEIEKHGNTNFITDSGLSSGQQIFAIGDSHSIFYYNSLKIKEHWGFGGKIPLTIYTFLQDDFNPYYVGTRLGNGHELYNIKQGDHVLFYYGFNDIQKNIYLHANHRWKDEIDTLFTNYINKLVLIRSEYDINIIVPCIYPNPRPDAKGVDCHGSYEERQMYIDYANQLLRIECLKHKLPFLDIYDIIIDQDKKYINEKISSDSIHLDYNNREVQKNIEDIIISIINSVN